MVGSCLAKNSLGVQGVIFGAAERWCATITPTRLASRGRECPRGSVVSSLFGSYRVGLTSATGPPRSTGPAGTSDLPG